jgi:hypothetical protein
MKLTIGDKLVALPEDAKISIQKSSPLLNEDPGSFSYPFPVPTLPNQHNLGWPGRLQRNGDITNQTFVLEDMGLQIFSGEVEYDSVTKNEIGVILKSGQTLFRSKVDGKVLSEIDYGYESWLPVDYNSLQVRTKIAEWNSANTTSNGKYVVSPTMVNPAREDVPLCVNKVDKTTGNLVYDPTYMNQIQLYMLQFRAYFILEKIFQSAGYDILVNELRTSDFSELIVFSQIINIPFTFESPSAEVRYLNYSKLMPNLSILEFIDNIANLLCMAYDIDERKKTVRIIFKKNIFVTENVSDVKRVELTGWEHSEKRIPGGFKLSYKTQDNELDTYTGFPNLIEVVSALPTPTIENKILMVLSSGYTYITISDGGVFSWKRVGRLREILIGNGAEKVELAVKIPQAIVHLDGYMLPKLELNPISETINLNMIQKLNFDPISELIVSLYHGRKNLNTVGIPYTSGEQWGVAPGWSVNVATYLTPKFLYEEVYSDFLNWKAYRARSFTKYIQLTLPEALSLQWDKKYVIGDITVILDKINFELPYTGMVKTEGFTV